MNVGTPLFAVLPLRVIYCSTVVSSHSLFVSAFASHVCRRDPKNYYHIPPDAYPGPVDPPFVPGPSYLVSGPLLLALARTFPIAPQHYLDLWRGFEDKFVGMQIEYLQRGLKLPVRIVGRYEYYADFASTAALAKKPSYCDPGGWATKLAVQVIQYNESHPLPQFRCPGWDWPT